MKCMHSGPVSNVDFNYQPVTESASDHNEEESILWSAFDSCVGQAAFHLGKLQLIEVWRLSYTSKNPMYSAWRNASLVEKKN